MNRSAKQKSPLTLVLVAAFVLVGFSQLIATAFVYYNNSEFNKFKQSAQLQTIKVTRVSKETAVQKTRRSSSKRRKRSRNRDYTEVETTVYKIQYQYSHQGKIRQSGLVISKVPYFEQGDTVQAWVDPSRPTDTKIVGVNDAPINPMFVHMVAAGFSLFFSFSFGIFVFLSTLLVGKLKVTLPNELKDHTKVG